jgi:hypothetical protein
VQAARQKALTEMRAEETSAPPVTTARMPGPGEDAVIYGLLEDYRAPWSRDWPGSSRDSTG